MRLFLACPLPASVVEYVRGLQQALPSGVRSAAAPHITLKFLGDVPITDIPSIVKALDTITQKPIELHLATIGTFGGWARPRVIWLGVTPQATLARLHHALDVALSTMFGKDAEFQGHITLGRVKEKLKEGALDTLKTMTHDSRSFTLDELVLYRSTLTREGPVYEELHRVSFSP